MSSVASRPRSTGRGTWAVLAGFLTIVVVSTLTDLILHAARIFPPAGQSMSNGLWLLAIAYRIAYAIGGCYVTARLAPDRPMRHALVLGTIGLVVSIAGTVATWNRGPGFGPKWYPLALVAIALPCAWVGAKLAEKSAALLAP